MRRLDETVRVAGQVRPDEVAALAGEGVTMVINNRPDEEEPGQPTHAAIAAACEKAGIACRHVPIARGIGPSDVEAMRAALAEADGPVLAFCRTGNRSTLMWAVARHADGVSREALEAGAEAAGYSLAPVAHLLGD